MKINRKRASEDPDAGKTRMVPIAKLPKRKKPAPPRARQEPGQK